MKPSKFTAHIRSELLCEYEGLFVFAVYINGKFSEVLTFNEDGLLE